MLNKKAVLATAVAIFVMTAPTFAAVIKMQFDASTSAGSFTGAGGPGLATGDFTIADTAWNAFTGPIGSGLVYSDGSAATGVSLKVGEIIRTDGYPNVWTNSFYGQYLSPTASTFYNNALTKDVLYANLGGNQLALAVGVTGLPVGTYKMYISSIVAAAPERSYSISYGKNIIPDPYLPLDLSGLVGATTTPIGDGNVSSWIAGRNYIVTNPITLSSTSDILTFVVSGPINPALAGFQIISVVPEPTAFGLLGLGGLGLLRIARCRKT